MYAIVDFDALANQWLQQLFRETTHLRRVEYCFLFVCLGSMSCGGYYIGSQPYIPIDTLRLLIENYGVVPRARAIIIYSTRCAAVLLGIPISCLSVPLTNANDTALLG